jgi:hypothetical protein
MHMLVSEEGKEPWSTTGTCVCCKGEKQERRLRWTWLRLLLFRVLCNATFAKGLTIQKWGAKVRPY